jgi:hypothetical protein
VVPAGSFAHGFSCSRRLSPLSGRNSTYRSVQISATGSHYDRISGPSAKAYRLLERIDLGPDLGRRGDGAHLQFKEGGGNPFDYSLHVHASDMLALSLLQARLVDLRLPIKLQEWKYR